MKNREILSQLINRFNRDIDRLMIRFQRNRNIEDEADYALVGPLLEILYIIGRLVALASAFIYASLIFLFNSIIAITVLLSQFVYDLFISSRITKVPGTRLLTTVDFLFRPATVELTFKPLIGEWQSEYFEALNQGRTKKARWVSFRYRFIFACTFIKAMKLSKVFSIFKQLSK